MAKWPIDWPSIDFLNLHLVLLRPIDILPGSQIDMKVAPSHFKLFKDHLNTWKNRISKLGFRSWKKSISVELSFPTTSKLLEAIKTNSLLNGFFPVHQLEVKARDKDDNWLQLSHPLGVPKMTFSLWLSQKHPNMLVVSNCLHSQLQDRSTKLSYFKKLRFIRFLDLIL